MPAEDARREPHGDGRRLHHHRLRHRRLAPGETRAGRRLLLLLPLLPVGRRPRGAEPHAGHRPAAVSRVQAHGGGGAEGPLRQGGGEVPLPAVSHRDGEQVLVGGAREDP